MAKSSQAPARAAQPPPPRRSPWAWLVLGVGGLAVAGGIALTLTRSGGASGPSVGLAERGDDPRTIRAVAGGSAESIHRVSTSPLVEAGRPIVFFMGAQFCPFCAAERWAFVKATARFGTWTGLGPLHSQTGSDGFDTLPTYDLLGADFHSDLLSLHHKEIADLNGNPLQPLVGIEQDLVNRYDPRGGFPFLVASGPAGQSTVGLGYSPGLLQGRSFDALRAAVDSGADTPAVGAIDAEANAITALLCTQTGGKPGEVCTVPAIAALELQLR